ncbi:MULTISPECIES: pyridoxamine 5'-phosphate oxidase family protein [unclassified Streptomyces]|uniref:pyridoxamine 5'-phosphate oxidase family protein n=1 Tax=unclassified Streptomyces TaxID=2593676 RepID=UPI00225BF374|nr:MULTISPECIES: pyridoxamine 5'-phosphate oxidase family protein [unclassified Streptomyces]MCX5054930.1 pyridoxamine 5'-phosphate oxidase family protein [Streptomyces sp. NBC_00474]
MKIDTPPRDPRERRQDVLRRLQKEIDIWVASADADGLPCLVPLWFVWHAESVWLVTRTTNPTGRNLRDGRRARLAFGDTRDVVLIDGDVETCTLREVPGAAAEAFLAKTGWDPRQDSASYAFFRVRPYAVQAWHEQRELAKRHLMKDGAWVV